MREICRRAGSKRHYYEDPDWAIPYLATMVERGILESDAHGRFRVKPKPKNQGGGRWLSPQIAEILKKKAETLKAKGLEIEPAGPVADDDDF